MWQKAGLILLGMALGASGMLAVLRRLNLLPRWRPFSKLGPAKISPDPQIIYDAAQVFLLAAETSFGSREEALKSAAWVNPSGKNVIPKALKVSHTAFKEVLKTAGKRRTPSGVHLVQTALKIVQDHNQSNSRASGPEPPKITFVEGEGMPTP